jgi:F-type H+-transporting ATPase subunit delta
MSAQSKKAQQLARQLLSLSVADGALSPERVAGVLAYVEKHRPAQPLLVLKTYRRLVTIELSRGQAQIEHAGGVSDQILQTIAAALAKKYGRPLTAVAAPNSALLAGLRVRVGDDVYESSIANQLAGLVA